MTIDLISGKIGDGMAVEKIPEIDNVELSFLIDMIIEPIDYLTTLKVINPIKARDLITNKNREGDKLVDALIKLQNAFGIMVNLHPESIYSPQFKQTSDMYKNMSDVSENLSYLIDETLNMWQWIKSKGTPITQKSAMFCYKHLIKCEEKSRISFTTLIVRILSDGNKLVGYLMSLTSSEKLKAYLSNLRAKTMAVDIEIFPDKYSRERDKAAGTSS